MYQLETRFARINQCQLRRAEQSLHFASIPTNSCIFIILRLRPRTYASTSPLLLVQLHQQQQLLSINIISSTNHHLQHTKLRILLQRLTSHAAYERAEGRQSGPPRSALVYMYIYICFPGVPAPRWHSSVKIKAHKMSNILGASD